jgi:ABC-type cobalamin/Fe3+-siderophores transport system ATPase subunit
VQSDGAGKSTLMKILGGVHQPDAREILIEGMPVEINGVTGQCPSRQAEPRATILHKSEYAFFDACGFASMFKCTMPPNVES